MITSWSGSHLKPKPPVDVLDRFPEERQALLDVLTTLATEAWNTPTVCAGWSVKDLTAHILADDLGNLSGGRDRYRSGTLGPSPDWDELVRFINEQNEAWVRASRRLSPQVLIELLTFSGERVSAYFRTLDPMSPGWVVSWAGPDAAPWWLHIAREYTERWAHHQQIREAVGAAGLFGRRHFAPVLDTFVHALPHTYRDLPAADGTHVRLVVGGEAGGAWSLVRHDRRWGLYDEVEREPATVITLDQDTAWRLYTRGIGRDAVRARLTVTGDARLSEPLLDTVAIIA
ncbi:MAG: maleylpyruvate isomerase family mycothiol-dependent enzyme [Dehalococcoidia bacterium]